MEGLPHVPMISPDLKIPVDSSLSEQFIFKVSKYISEHYQDDPSKFHSSFEELNRMRKHISRCNTDVETLCVMKSYFSQLTMLKKRFPMEENDIIALPYSWIDKATDLSSPLTYEDINFELCCILFNIGAVHSVIAANEVRSSADSIKNAFMNFQCAAWPLQYLRDDMGCGRYSMVDFEVSILTFYLNVLLAQAQECLLEKAFIDHRNSIAIARLTIYLSTLYDECATLLEESVASELISSSRVKELSRICRGKSDLYFAISHYHRSINADENKKMGLKLAHLTFALEHIKKAAKCVEKDKSESLKQAVVFALDLITQNEIKARKENDIIYHQLVPKREDIENLEGVVMVKPIAFDICDISIGGEDLFKSLLPIDVIKSISLYCEEKASLKRCIVDKIDKMDAALEEYLTLMRLDQLNLDTPSEQMRLPDELLRCSAAFTAQPDAFPTLLDKFYKLTTQSTEAERILMDLLNRLRRIDDPSFTDDKGYKAIEEKITNLINQQEKARESNNELQHAMASHSESLRLLFLPLNKLTEQICGDFFDPSNSKEGVELLTIRDKVDEMRKQRAYLLQEFLKNLESDDISTKLLSERDRDTKILFQSELKKHEINIDLIEKNLQAQEFILKRLTEANACFADFRQKIIDNTEKRKNTSLTLITAYKAFDSIVDGTNKALFFYEQLFSKIKYIQKGVKNIEDIYNEMRNKSEAEKFVSEWSFK